MDRSRHPGDVLGTVAADTAGGASSRPDTRPVVVGEVLFDRFPDGGRVLGGAPFNLAWHLQALGFDPLLISRVGADREGDEVVAAMVGWGLDASGVQRDPRRPTGAVRVGFEHDEPTFEIPAGQAWDHLEAAPALAAVRGARVGLLCHGSLVLRAAGSRAALASLRSGTGLPVFVDVNLRDPFWRRDEVEGMLAGSRWVKLNQRELLELLGTASPGVEDAAVALRDRWDLDQVWVTRGALGAVVASASGIAAATPPPPPAVEVVDSVGAGDAFSAVVVAGLQWGWAPERTLHEAVAFAARVCTLRGATARDPDLYTDLLRARDENRRTERADV